MATRNYGWKPSKPDSRDFRLKTVNPVVYKSLPSSVDLRPIIPEVLDQGELGSCFSGDTVIPLMNGKERTLKELSEGIEGDFFYIYSLIFNDKFYEVVPAIASAFKTRENQKTIRIFLDNGEWFDCTLDHKLLSREGEYIEAKDISVGQSLMPLNRKIDNSWLKGYELVENPGEKWHYTHKISSKFDKELSTPKGSVIHHKVIKIIENEHFQDVYCLNVPETENFAIKAGIFVHNCTANALTMAHRIARIKQGLPDMELSRLFVYYNERLMEGTVDEDAGAEIRDGAKVLGTYGAPVETDWPYVESKFRDKPTEQSYKDAVQDEASQYMTVEQTENEIKMCLHEGYPVVFGANIFQEFEGDEVARTGVVPMPTSNSISVGGHAILIVGYDDNTRRFTVLNSWSKDWGDKGYCYFPYDYITDPNLCSDFWTIRTISPSDPNRKVIIP